MSPHCHLLSLSLITLSLVCIGCRDQEPVKLWKTRYLLGSSNSSSGGGGGVAVGGKGVQYHQQSASSQAPNAVVSLRQPDKGSSTVDVSWTRFGPDGLGCAPLFFSGCAGLPCVNRCSCCPQTKRRTRAEPYRVHQARGTDRWRQRMRNYYEQLGRSGYRVICSSSNLKYVHALDYEECSR